jgi:hypothetical protein
MAIPPRNVATPKPPANQQSSNVVRFEKVLDSKYGHRAILYGTGGIGKSTLACLAPGPVAFVDADESLEKLKPQLLEAGIPVPVKIPAKSWAELRSMTQSSGYDGIKTIVYDVWTPIQQWMEKHTLLTVKKDNNSVASSIEDYGYGKGYKYNFDTFSPLLGDMDAHIRAGRNIIILAHDDAVKVPNPGGMDFLRWEPAMQNTPAASIRKRMCGWADHVLYLAYDINVEKASGDDKGRKAGRATGVGFRTLYTAEMPHYLAKSRTTNKEYSIMHNESPWAEIIK